MNLEIHSPNSVLANSLLKSVDLLRPRIEASRPSKIEFVVGTQINGVPHAGTALVQAAAFCLSRLARRSFSIDSTVLFSALDNAPYEVTTDPESFHSFQKTYHHALGSEHVRAMVDDYYIPYFEALSDLTDAEYSVQLYTEQQLTPEYRVEFLRSLARLDDIRWWLSPSHGVVHLRLPCPQCGWAEKRAERTHIVRAEEDVATLSAVCLDHGKFEADIEPVNETYIDLATLYRNLVKERASARPSSVLQVMVKGGDWAYGCQLVDGAHAAIGTPPQRIPARIFTPMVLTDSGAKLSKSLIRDSGMVATGVQDNPWLLNATSWGDNMEFARIMEWLAEGMLADPKHFYRNYTTQELVSMVRGRPDFANIPRVRSMAIYKRYFDLIASGEKTVEVRVAYSSMQRIKPGQLLRFTCRNDECLTRVKRVANYTSFDEMFDHEDSMAINPNASREEQILEIRKIFPPEKERLGVIALEVERYEPEA